MFKVINLRITMYFAVFTIISIFIITPVTLHFLSFMLGFNVFLAYIPMFIVWYILKLQKDIEYSKIRVASVILFVVFVLFYPNTFYIITDLIHIDNADFYQYIELDTYNVFQTKEYLKDIIPYIILVQTAFALILGVFAGVYSLLEVEKLMFIQGFKKVIREVVVVSILVLSSIGIYIGRFLRFFSWEILNPIKILKLLYADFSLFTVLFILLFTIVQVVLYYSYKNIVYKLSVV